MRKNGEGPFSGATAGRTRGIGANEKGSSPSQPKTPLKEHYQDVVFQTLIEI
jgi:hypothetical protein